MDTADLGMQGTHSYIKTEGNQHRDDHDSGLNFGMFLRHNTAEFGVVVLSVNEAYTTKTVSWTGELLDGVGGASVIEDCDGERMDRDHNGARGIYLRALGDTLVLRESLSGCAASVASPHLSGNMSKVV